MSSQDPVDELNEAFEACLTIPTEEARACAEQNITKFIDAARRLEVFFLQKQLLLAGGEIEKEIKSLEAELKSRDELIAKCSEKFKEWKNIV